MNTWDGNAVSYSGGGGGMDFFGIGTAVSGLLGYQSAKKANQMNREMAIQNREWQERMSSTAHRRQVADMRAAGLNPILSATGGHGASTGSGGVGNAMQAEASAGVASALEYRRQKADNELTRQEIRNRRETQEVLHYEKQKRMWEANTAVVAFDQAIEQKQAMIWDNMIRKMDVQVGIDGLKGRRDQAQMESSDAYKAKRYLDAGTDSAGRVTGAVRNLLPWGGKGRPSGSSARSNVEIRRLPREPRIRATPLY